MARVVPHNATSAGADTGSHTPTPTSSAGIDAGSRPVVVSAPSGPATGGPALVAQRRDLVVRRFPFWVAAVCGTVALATVLGLTVKHLFDGTALVRYDERLAQRIAENRTGTGDTWSGIATFFADPIPVAVLWFVAMVVAWRAFRSWIAPLVIAAGVGGEKLSYYLTTLLVDRPRPDVPTIGQRHVTSSFPSGHVGSAVSLYGTIAVVIWLYLWRRRRNGGGTPVSPDGALVAMSVIVAIIGVAVAVARMYRGFHFLSDVITGAAIGVAWVLVPVALLVERSKDRSTT